MGSRLYPNSNLNFPNTGLIGYKNTDGISLSLWYRARLFNSVALIKKTLLYHVGWVDPYDLITGLIGIPRLIMEIPKN